MVKTCFCSSEHVCSMLSSVPRYTTTVPQTTGFMHCSNRHYPGGVASRLATVIYVAMVMPIRIVQMTQISNMKVIGPMVDFF